MSPLSEAPAVLTAFRPKIPRAGRSSADARSEAMLESIESLVAEIRAQPGNFPDENAIAERSGLEPERLADLFRRHYHSTPGAVLKRAKIDAAKRLLLVSKMPSAKIAQALSYESSAKFDADFQALNGLLPQQFRKLKGSQSFSIQLPTGYPLGYLRRALGRDKQSATERLEGDIYTTAIRLDDGTQLLTLVLAGDSVRVSTEIPTIHMPKVHAIVAGLVGLDQNASEFASLATQLELHRLIDGRAQMRISQTHTVFDGLLWAIVGQQINFPFACLLKRRLIELTGTSLPNGLFPPPTAQAVAALEPADLIPLQFSRQKADYVIATARLISEGTLDLDALRFMSATRAERTLLAIRGLGPWSVNYLMIRSLGFSDCLPLGDTGVTSGLQSLFRLKRRPDAKKTLRLMAPFSPFRSLATAHLWQLDKPTPD